jgi:hypothetical protein
MTRVQQWSAEIEQLIEQQIVKLGDAALSRAFAAHILTHYPTLPPRVGGVDWAQVDSAGRIERPDVAHADLSVFFLSMRVSSFSRIAVVRSPVQPYLALSLTHLLKYLPVLVGPRVTYFVGLLAVGGGHQLAFDQFVECRIGDSVYLSGLPRSV